MIYIFVCLLKVEFYTENVKECMIFFLFCSILSDSKVVSCHLYGNKILLIFYIRFNRWGWLLSKCPWRGLNKPSPNRPTTSVTALPPSIFGGDVFGHCWGKGSLHPHGQWDFHSKNPFPRLGCWAQGLFQDQGEGCVRYAPKNLCVSSQYSCHWNKTFFENLKCNKKKKFLHPKKLERQAPTDLF